MSLLAACGQASTGATGSASASTSAAPTTSAAAPATTSAPATTTSSAAATTTSAAAATTTTSAAATTATTTSSAAAASTASASSSSAAATSSGKPASVRTDITKMPDAQTLRINLGGEPDAIDPNLAEFVNEIAVVRQVFDPLVLLDKDLKPVPGGAASWTTSSDGLTWTFKIRPHKWSDGTAVKASDYEFSFKRILDPNIAAPYAGYFAGVIKGSADYNNAVISNPKNATAPKPTVTPADLTKLRDAVGVKATDDSTLVLTLEQPTPFLLDLISLATVPPLREDMVKGDWTLDVKNYIGNGKFVLIQHTPQDQLVFAPNPNYWGGAPKIGMQWRIITDTNAAFAAYRNGELDIVAPPRANVPNIKQDPQMSKEFVVNPALTVFWMYYEFKHPPLDNVNFRYALSQAFDRDTFITDQFKGLGVPATFIIPKGMPGYDPNGGADYKFDVTKAKQSLAASKVDPASVKLSILHTNNPVTSQYVSYIIAMIKKNIGVTLTARPVESKARVAAQKKHDFDLVWSGWGADYPDQQDWFDLFRTGDGNNNGEYSNPDFDKIVKQADLEMDATKRDDLYKQAAAIIYKDQPALIMYQDVNFGLVKPWVQGIVYTGQDDAPAIGDYFYNLVTLGKRS